MRYKLMACRKCGVMFEHAWAGMTPVCNPCIDADWKCDSCGCTTNDDGLHLLNGSEVCPIQTK